MNPFRGLDPLAEGDAIYGRDRDFLLMRERLYSCNTTLLFAASGVGKTSFLRARLLKAIDGEEFDTCYHRDWAGKPPLDAVLGSIAAKLTVTLAPDATLASALESYRRPQRATPSPDAALELRPPRVQTREFLLVLDQFEEVFQHYAFSDDLKAFVAQLSEIMNSTELRVRIIISMRDDFLGRLSVFDNQVPDLFNNYYRLKSPTKAQAMEIIARTAEPRGVDAAGLRALVDDLAVFRRTVATHKTATSRRREDTKVPSGWRTWRNRWARRGRRLLEAFLPIGRQRKPQVASVDRDFVVPPYLQIVCQELWTRDPDATTSFLAKYTDHRAGDAAPAVILNRFCERQLKELKSTAARDLAAKAFDFLMTRDGAKMAYQLDRLAEHMDVKRKDLKPVLDALSNEGVRLLRRFPGPDESSWYELYHDMYALILDEWKRGYHAGRARHRRVQLWLTVGAVVLLSVVGVRAWTNFTAIRNATDDYPWRSYNGLQRALSLGGLIPSNIERLSDEVWARYWDRRAARAELGEDRDRALLLRATALEARPTSERQNAALLIAGGDYQDALAATVNVSGTPTAFFLARNGRRMLVASNNGTAYVLDTTDVTRVREMATLRDPSTAAFLNRDVDATPRLFKAASFLDDDTLITLGDEDRTLRWWRPGSTDGEWQETVCASSVTTYVETPVGVILARNGQLERFDVEKAEEDDCEADAPVAVQVLEDAPPAFITSSRTPRAAAASAISDMIYVADGERILAATDAGDVCVWNVRAAFRRGPCVVKGATSVRIDVPTKRIAAIVPDPDPDEDFLATFRLYDFSGRRIGAEVDKMDGSESIVFSRGRAYAVDFDTVSGVLDAVTGVAVRDAAGAFPGDPAHVSPTGQFVVPGSDESRVYAAEHRLQQPFIAEKTTAAAFTPDGAYLVTGSSSGRVRFWRAAAFREIDPGLLGPGGEGPRIMLGAEHRCAAYVGAQGVEVRNLASGRMSSVKPLTVRTVAVSPDCRTAAVVGNGDDVRIWTVASGETVGVPLAWSGGRLVPLVLFSPDSSKLLVWRRPTTSRTVFTVGLFTGAGRLVSRIEPRLASTVALVRGISFSADSNFVIFAVGRQPTEVYSVADGRRVPGEVPPGAVVGRHGNRLVIRGADGAYLVTLSSPIRSRRLTERDVSSATFSADGRYLMAIEAGRLRFLDVQTGSALPFPQRQVSAVRFHPSDPRLAVASGETGVQLVDLREQRAEPRGIPVPIGSRALPDRDGLDSAIIQFSPDGGAVIATTHEWVHRLMVTDGGLRAQGSRRLSSARFGAAMTVLDEDGSRVAVLLDSPTRIEIVDFNAAPPAREVRTAAEWQQRLGLRLEEGEFSYVERR